MSRTLRTYQVSCCDAIIEAHKRRIVIPEEGIDRAPRVLVVLATGLGKTVIMAEMIKRMTTIAGRAMVLSHREELVTQASKTIQQWTGERCDIEMGDLRANEDGFRRAKVVVSSIQTQNAGRTDRKRRRRFDPIQFAYLGVDEAHHSSASSWIDTILYYADGNPDMLVCGQTATPDRADEAALGDIYDEVAFEYDVADGIRDGWLVPVKQRFVAVEDLDFTSVRTSGGDFKPQDLNALLEFEGNLHGMAFPTLRIVGGRKTICFTSSVDQAERISEIFNRHKPGCSRVVTGKTPRNVRRQMLRDYAAGRFQFLVNVDVATEGFDEPSIEVVAIMRPTKSRAKYAQMIGRGTRALAGVVDGCEDDAAARKEAIDASAKKSVLVLDFVGVSGHHALIHAADILGGKTRDEIVKRVKKKEQTEDDEFTEHDVLAELDHAELERARELDAQRRAKIKARAEWTTRDVDPFSRLGIEPCREPSWHRGKPPTPKQLHRLRMEGIPTPDGMSFSRASQIIGEIFTRKTLKGAGVPEHVIEGVAPKERSRIAREIESRRGAGLSTYRQSSELVKMGYDRARIKNMSKDEAALILKQQGS